MKSRTKKWITISALSVVCIALIGAIGSQFIQEKAVDEPLPTASSTPAYVSVNPITENEDVVVNPQPQKPTPPTSETEKPAVSSGTEQTIQQDVAKPAPPAKPDTAVETDKPHEKPTDPALANPDKQPDTTPAPTKPSEPQGGEKKDGKIYVPGFGWIEDKNGETIVNDSGSDGDINKPVGEM